MIVECGKCSTKFKIGDEKVTSRGVKVRCSKCKHVFVVKKGGEIEPVAPPSTPPPPAVPAKPKPAPIQDDIPEDVFRVPTKVGPPRPGDVAASIPDDIFPVPSPNLTGQKAPSQIQFPPASKPPEAPAAPAAPPPKPAAPVSTLPPTPKAIPPPPIPPPESSPTGTSALPPDGGKSLADQIDLDMDGFDLPAPPPKTPAAPPAPTPPAAQAAPVQPAGIGGDLFSDLLGVKPSGATPAPASPTAAPKPTVQDDDPFADIDISSPGPATVPKTDPALPPGSADPTSGPAVGKPTQDLFDNLGDPFAGLGPEASAASTPPAAAAAPDLTPPPPAAPPAAPAAPPAAPAAPPAAPAAPPAAPAAPPTADAGSMDDPFQLGSSEGGVAAGQPAAPAPDDDPFAEIDIGATGPSFGGDAGDAAGDLFGDNDLSQLGDAASGFDPAPAPSGLELDQDGKLTGEPLPVPEPPTKAVRSEDTAQVRREPAPLPVPSPPPVVESSEPVPSGGLWAYKLGFGLIALLLALFLFVAYRSGGNPDLASWSTYVEAFTGESASDVVDTDFRALGLNNTAYRNQAGHDLIILWGEVKNTTEEQKSAVTVSGKMVDPKGRVMGEFTAPAGIAFTPLEVHRMDSRDSVTGAYHSQLPKVTDLKLDPGKSAPFMLVFFDHPAEMDEVEFRVRTAVSQDPLRGLPPAPAPDEESEESDEQASRAPPAGKQPASPRGVGVKKSGTFVRLKPAKGKSSKPGP